MSDREITAETTSGDEMELRQADFDPDWVDAEDEDDEDFMPAAEDLSGSELEAFEDAEENILSALLGSGDIEIEIADGDDEDEDEDEDENEDDEEEDDAEQEEAANTTGRVRQILSMYSGQHTRYMTKIANARSPQSSPSAHPRAARPTGASRSPPSAPTRDQQRRRRRR